MGIRAFHFQYSVFETGRENRKSRNEQLLRFPSIFIDEIQHPALRTHTDTPPGYTTFIVNTKDIRRWFHIL